MTTTYEQVMGTINDGLNEQSLTGSWWGSGPPPKWAGTLLANLAYGVAKPEDVILSTLWEDPAPKGPRRGYVAVVTTTHLIYGWIDATPENQQPTGAVTATRLSKITTVMLTDGPRATIQFDETTLSVPGVVPRNRAQREQAVRAVRTLLDGNDPGVSREPG